MNKQKEYQISIIAGGILLLLGSFYHFSGLTNNIISFIVITAGITIVVVKTFQLNKFGAGVYQDERTRKISSRGISYSWLLTFLTLNLLFWIDILDVAKIELNQGIGIIIFVMIISAALFKYILKDKEI